MLKFDNATFRIRSHQRNEHLNWNPITNWQVYVNSCLETVPLYPICRQKLAAFLKP